jgi:hypothetical protein
VSLPSKILIPTGLGIAPKRLASERTPNLRSICEKQILYRSHSDSSQLSIHPNPGNLPANSSFSDQVHDKERKTVPQVVGVLDWAVSSNARIAETANGSTVIDEVRGR